MCIKREDGFNIIDDYQNIFPKILLSIKEIAETAKYTGELRLKSNWIMKVANSYDSEKYFPVFTREYLIKICDTFGIEKNKDIYQMNQNILAYFKKELADLTPWKVMTIFDRIFVKGSIDDLKIEEKNTVLTSHVEFAQFHPSYDYTDFVEGLRPVQKENGEIGFELKNGIFKEFCIEAIRFPKENFVFIIDEINRAELSKVFGELFYSIEPGYRGGKGKVQLQYSNLYTGKDSYDPF
ncbi:MAG: hypothetical protein ACRCTJ_05835, partial [Brevinema sp.]